MKRAENEKGERLARRGRSRGEEDVKKNERMTSTTTKKRGGGNGGGENLTDAEKKNQRK